MISEPRAPMKTLSLTVGGVSDNTVTERNPVQPENIEQIDVQSIAFNTVEKSC